MSRARKSAAIPSNPLPAAGTAARLFFALWPDAVTRGHLAHWADLLHRTCGGRRVRDDQLHVTLAFLGDVARERIPELHAIACSLGAGAFALRFTQPTYAVRQRLAWAAPFEVPGDLAELAARLASSLRNAGFRTEDRRYLPHVTLLRDARRRAMPEGLVGFEWCVRQFVLVESRLQRTGSAYEVIGAWPLGQLAGAPD